MRITDKGNKTEAVVRSVKRYEFRLVLRTEDEFSLAFSGNAPRRF